MSNTLIHPVILSGGLGRRLWPVSRKNRPKQFLSFGGSDPLIVETARRAQGGGFAPPLIICNAEHRFLVAECFSGSGPAARRIILEPVGRGTAAAIAVACLSVPDEALVLVMPSDHVIAAVDRFHDALARARAAAEMGHIVGFGVVPTRPETGYGYIEHGSAIGGAGDVLGIARFHEKPDLATAKAYLAGGRHSWNAGIFLFQASAVLRAFRRFAPDVLAGARAALDRAVTDLDFLRLDAVAFTEIPSMPFDTAIMEKTSLGAVVPVDMGWSDIGSWRSMWEVAEKDENGNAAVGDVRLLNTRNSLAWSRDGTMTALVGVQDLLVVASDGAVLIAGAAQSEAVAELVMRLEAEAEERHLSSRRVHRPWGNYETLDAGPGYLGKRLTVNPGARLSLQFHRHRAEHWVVVFGVARVTREDRTFDLHANESTFLPKETVHRLENPGSDPLVLIEIQTGDLLSEEDIVRLDDVYGRARPAQ